MPASATRPLGISTITRAAPTAPCVITGAGACTYRRHAVGTPPSVHMPNTDGVRFCDAVLTNEFRRGSRTGVPSLPVKFAKVLPTVSPGLPAQRTAPSLDVTLKVLPQTSRSSLCIRSKFRWNWHFGFLGSGQFARARKESASGPSRLYFRAQRQPFTGENSIAALPAPAAFREAAVFVIFGPTVGKSASNLVLSVAEKAQFTRKAATK